MKLVLALLLAVQGFGGHSGMGGHSGRGGGAGSVATPALVQHNATGANAGDTTLTNLGANHLVVVFVDYTSFGDSTISDTAGNTWVDSGEGSVAYNTSLSMRIWYTCNSISHAGTDTITASGGAGSVHAYEISGVPTSSCRDTSSHTANGTTPGSGTTNNATAPGLTTGGADIVITAASVIGGPLSAGTNVAWTSPDGDKAGLMEYFIQSSGGAITPAISDGTTSDPYGAIGIAFKP